jgi:transposase, IS5 family
VNKVHGIMGITKKKRASAPLYISPNQLSLEGFQTPFEQKLSKDNRWVVLAQLIPWDDVCAIYLKHVGVSTTGRPAISPRIVLGSLIIKHLGNLDDRETVEQIRENMYMQYFLGYSSFISEPPFDPSLFVEFRKRLGMDNLNAINEKIVALKTRLETSKNDSKPGDSDQKPPENNNGSENRGRVIFDATACPQDIAYPTDLNLLSDAREKSEELIDLLYDRSLHKRKPRTYRKVARKRYLQTAQKKNKSRKVIRKAVGSQLRFVKRNLNSVNRLINAFPQNPLNPKQLKYLQVIDTVYQQQQKMYDVQSHTVEDRIVSIHQPHVRPIVRGKSQAKVEFGAKIHVSIIDGISFLDELSWDAFNEGTHMMEYVERYKVRFGCYPRELLADQIYCNRANRAALKEKGIRLMAKPLGRPSAVQKHVSPGERNPIEGKFGQAKTAYGLDRIKARLKDTSESWIACIFLVLNLVKLAGVALLCLLSKTVLRLSTKAMLKSSISFIDDIQDKIFLLVLQSNPKQDIIIKNC